ncbi:MAG: hypothetical protein KGQ70_00130, partial [Alphaproteobacteria bacterium]|nr:hypothetical protein [Alphaproteobacteria bacterium]
LLAPKSGALDAPVFLVIFRRELVLGRPKEALFWLQLGRFRLRYDLLRCGGTPGDARNFDALLSAAPSPQIDAFLRAHPAEMKGSLRRVLAFDAQYPAANDPARFCKIAVPGGTPASRDEWPLYRAALRRQTEEFIARKTAAAPPEKAGKDVSAPHRAVPRPKNRVK